MLNIAKHFSTKFSSYWKMTFPVKPVGGGTQVNEIVALKSGVAWVIADPAGTQTIPIEPAAGKNCPWGIPAAFLAWTIKPRRYVAVFVRVIITCICWPGLTLAADVVTVYGGGDVWGACASCTGSIFTHAVESAPLGKA